MDICIVGSGYVGLVTGASFAEMGNKVICVDSNRSKIDKLKKGIMPIYEPGLKELVNRNRKNKRINFTTDLAKGVKNSEIIFICVSTPPKPNGEADLVYVEDVSRQIAREMVSYRLIVEKSTVPVQTGEWIKKTIRQTIKKGVPFDVASNPEFLREGSAVQDLFKPDRIVIGAETKRAKDILVKLYKPLKVPLVVTDIKSAEIIKHASNSFLATKISFINAVSVICEKAGADVIEVAEGMGMDKRICRAFLDAGVGFGGSCFPKDLSAFISISERLGYEFDLLRAVQRINEHQKELLVKRVEKLLWNLSEKTVAIWGLSFKPNTDDMRSAPSVDIIKMLQKRGASIKVYDPQAMPVARKLLKGVKFCKDAYSAAADSDCLVVATDWDEFKEADLKRLKKVMNQPVVVDGRNIYDPATMKGLGFEYTGIGRSLK
ncbi:MAG: UDP-glucose/GDP-mannose dehydrogenase family protein [Candidatus Omnitrophica bacterium]|nr:UDP-glucose/GDP-mannose dehydrogenase family protein [Candidatus Omnitrophota bacterium]